MTVIGEAFVILSPESSQFLGKAEGQLSGIVDKLGGPLVVGTTAALAAVGAGLFAIGDKFDEQFDKVAIKTGATGKALDALKGDFKNVLGDTAGSMAQVGDALGLISTRTGLTGSALDDFTKKEVNLATITKTDVGANVEATTTLFNKWGVAAKDQSGQLDVLFKASQASGVSVGELADQLKTGEAPLSAFGFSLDQSTALFAGFDKAGFDAGKTTAALNKAFVTLSKEGLDPAQAKAKLLDLVNSMQKGTLSAADQTEAIKIFGTRGVLTLEDAAKKGAFSVDSLYQTITNGKGGIDATTKASEDFGEKWDRIKNKVLIVLEPVAIKVFGAISDGMDAITKAMDKVGPLLSGVGNSLKDYIVPAVGALAAVLATLAAAGIVSVIAGVVAAVVGMAGAFTAAAATGTFLEVVLAAIGGPVTLVVVAIAAVVAGVIYAYQHFKAFRDVVKDVIDFVTTQFGHLQAYAAKIWPQIQEAITHVMNVIRDVINAAVTVISFVWDHFGKYILQVVRAAWDAVSAVVETAVNVIKDIIQFVLAVINGDWGKAWNAIKDIPVQVFGLIITLVKDALKIIGSLLQIIGSVIWEGIKFVFKLIVDEVKALPRQILNLLETLPGLLLKLWLAGWELVIKGLVAVGKLLFEEVKKLPGQILRGLEGLGGLLLKLWLAEWNLLVKALSAIGKFLLEEVKKIPGLVLKGLEALGKLLYEASIEAISLMVAGLLIAVVGVFRFFANLPKWIGELVKDAGTWLSTTGMDLINGALNGIVEGAKALWKWFTDLPQNLWNLVVTVDTWLYQTGINLLTGAWNGIVEGAKAVWKWFVDLPTNIKNIVVGAATWLLQTGADILTGAYNGIIAGATAFWKWFTDLPQTLKDSLKDAATWLLGVGGSIIDGIVSGIAGAAQKVIDAIKKNVIDVLPDFVKKALGIKSPSTVFAEIGANIMQGMALGISANAHLPQKALDAGLPRASLSSVRVGGAGVNGSGAVANHNITVEINAPGATPQTVGQLRTVAREEIATAFSDVLRKTTAGSGSR